MADASLTQIIKNLEDHSISPYGMISYLIEDGSFSDLEILSQYKNHPSDYVRLCLAWYMGETRKKIFFVPLVQSYDSEKDDNVRANIVWALFSIDSNIIDISLFTKFLKDKYFLVSLIAIKRLNQVESINGKIKFRELYSKFDNTLIKNEILRKISYLSTVEEDLAAIENELYRTKDFMLKMELLKSIGELNKKNSTQLLLQYFEEEKENILQNEALAYKYVEAVQATTQSSPCHFLYLIYVQYSSQLLRIKIIETLSVAGGPECLKKLEEILTSEQDELLVNLLKKSISLITVTIK